MRSLFAALKDLLLPAACLSCGMRLTASRPPLLCSACLSRLRLLRSPLCTCCGRPFLSGGDHLCGECLQDHFAFDRARSLLLYQSPAAELIRDLKYAGQLTALASLKALILQWGMSEEFVEPDLVLPVPLHPQRLRERGFNQAGVIARGCFPQWRKRIAHQILIRHRPTSAQSSLSGRERRRSLREAFSVTDRKKVEGRQLLLIDDVYTTGSTVHACSAVLRRAGAARIEVFTLARTLPR